MLSNDLSSKFCPNLWQIAKIFHSDLENLHLLDSISVCECVCVGWVGRQGGAQQTWGTVSPSATQSWRKRPRARLRKVNNCSKPDNIVKQSCQSSCKKLITVHCNFCCQGFASLLIECWIPTKCRCLGAKTVLKLKGLFRIGCQLTARFGLLIKDNRKLNYH